MNITKVKFEKPKPYEIQKYGNFDWSFLVEVDEVLPHGYHGFGGIVRKTGATGQDASAVQWEAKSWSAAPFGPPSSSRENAIHGCLDDAKAALRVWKDQMSTHDAKVQERNDVAKVLRVGLPEGVKVWVSNADKIDDPLQFHIEIKNLDGEAVQKWLALLRIS